MANDKLTRAEAARCAWLSYATDEPAVIELLLLECDPSKSRALRLAAAFALEWFDPHAEIPRRPSDTDESEAVRLLRLALTDGRMRVRVAAGRQLADMLRPARSAWRKAS